MEKLCEATYEHCNHDFNHLCSLCIYTYIETIHDDKPQAWKLTCYCSCIDGDTRRNTSEIYTYSRYNREIVDCKAVPTWVSMAVRNSACELVLSLSLFHWFLLIHRTSWQLYCCRNELGQNARMHQPKLPGCCRVYHVQSVPVHPLRAPKVHTIPDAPGLCQPDVRNWIAWNKGSERGISQALSRSPVMRNSHVS